ncbi:MAG: hypothetical protein KGL16_14715 [Acidobacteriota bacterium]|nr:hypothetical protein [Acidobacteriota bacterium]
MTTVAEQVQTESRLRFRYAVIAFAAAILIVVSQLLQLSGAQPPVSEATVTLITENSRATIDIIGAALDMLGLLSLAYLLFWLHRSAQARQPTLRDVTRWTATAGAVLAAVMALVYTILFTQKAHQFVTTGDQSYPEASHLFSSALWFIPQLVLELGNLLLAVGVVLVALSAMRVGLITRVIGYAGVLSGALFIIGVPLLTPVVQGFWLAATAVLLARRWPSGDPPAWDSGEAVPWPPTARQQAQQDRARDRATRGQRRGRVTDKDVLAAVERREPPPNPRAGRAKRKRRK